MKMLINNMNRHFSGKKDLPDQFETTNSTQNKYSSDLIENELDLKPIISKKKKKSFKRFSLKDLKK